VGRCDRPAPSLADCSNVANAIVALVYRRTTDAIVGAFVAAVCELAGPIRDSGACGIDRRHRRASAWTAR